MSPADGAGSTARGVGLLLAWAIAVVAVAFLWPASLGGCTSLAVVPAGAAGPGLTAGDVVVTRCGPPGAGDRVVHRSPGTAWWVGDVVAQRAVGWRVRGADGVERTARGDLLAELPLQLSAASVATTVGGATLVAGGATVWGMTRRRRATGLASAAHPAPAPGAPTVVVTPG